MATYWGNSCSFGLRYVSWYKCLIVSLVFSHLGFWSGNLFLIAPFPDLCLLVPFSKFYRRHFEFISKFNVGLKTLFGEVWVAEWQPVVKWLPIRLTMFSKYKYLIVNLVFSHLGSWSGNFFLIVPFPDESIAVKGLNYRSNFFFLNTLTFI